MMNLDTADICTIIHDLTVAAEKYRANAILMTETGHTRLADSFIEQARNTDRIRTILRNELEKEDAA